MNENICELIFSCVSWQKAQQFVDVLLEKQLSGKTEILPAHTGHKVHVIVKARGQDANAIKEEALRIADITVVSSVSLVQ
jgi:hypothetical protein